LSVTLNWTVTWLSCVYCSSFQIVGPCCFVSLDKPYLTVALLVINIITVS
jgi:hypothetical protein